MAISRFWLGLGFLIVAALLFALQPGGASSRRGQLRSRADLPDFAVVQWLLSTRLRSLDNAESDDERNYPIVASELSPKEKGARQALEANLTVSERNYPVVASELSPKEKGARQALEANLTVSISGWTLGQVPQLLFPLATHVRTVSEETDVLLCGGECAVPEGFGGKVLQFNGEPYKLSPPTAHTVVVGAQGDVPVPYISFAAALRDYKSAVSRLMKPRPTQISPKFMMYASTHCIDFREDAVRAIASYVGKAVDAGGSCQPNGTIDAKIKTPPYSAEDAGSWYNSAEAYEPYRFTLNMENRKLDGYITEKLMLGFIGGGVPIYYGPAEIFKIFNKDAFIFYDINDPQPALDLILHLETNRTAYAKVLAQPILAKRGLEEYFSLSDDFGEGKLKQRLQHAIFTEAASLAPEAEY